MLSVLLRRYPDMFFNHFMECLFYFNSVMHHSWLVEEEGKKDGGNGNKQDEMLLFSLKGKIVDLWSSLSMLKCGDSRNFSP